MKTYLKLIAFISVFLLISCENEDDKTQIQQEDYFNLKVGNTWVYKNYTRKSNQELENNNILDSVIITDKFSFENKEFYVRETFKKYLTIHQTSLYQTDYLYINQHNHLISLAVHPEEENTLKEYVLHPGTDKELIFENEIIIGSNSYGKQIYQLENEKNIEIEGKSFLSSPFVGRLQPNDKITKELVTEYHYSKNIGLVKEIVPTVSGTTIFERHLISYKN